MNSKIDILFVHHLPVIGGSTQSLLGLVKHILQAGLTCKVLFLRHDGNAIERYREENIEIITTNNIHSYAHAYGAYNTFISRRPWRVGTNLIKTFQSTRKVQEILQHENPRLVYLNTSVLIPFAIGANKLSIPVIWHLREQIHQGNLGLRKKMVQTLFSKYATKIIAISKVNAMTLGIKNVEVIYNSVDFKVFDKELDGSSFKKEYGLNKPLQLCFIGGSVLSKGADILVEAIQEAMKKRQDFQLTIAGKFNSDPTKKMNRIEKRVYELIQANTLLKEKIVFTGSLNQVASLISASDILVWPATTPHFARPIMEAMVMAKPVIASNFLSSAEIVENGVHGLLVKPTVKNFSDAILELMNDEERRKQMGMLAYIKAKTLFDASVNNAKILHHIKSLLH